MRSKRVTKIVFGNILLAVLLLVPVVAVTAQENPYYHNPILNPRAMEDVIVDPSAVYGFRPDPNSSRLASFADAAWDDAESVAKWRQERIDYHNDFTNMYDAWKKMEAEGKSIEEIARYVSNMRNEIRTASYKDDPEGLARMKESNLAKYGNENGPTADSLYEKYGSWETVLKKSFSENPGMDACLGLYDLYYENYVKLGEMQETFEQQYTVVKNDNLCKIAEKFYGDAGKWEKIYNDNKDLIHDPNVLMVGQKLKINLY